MVRCERPDHLTFVFHRRCVELLGGFLAVTEIKNGFRATKQCGPLCEYTDADLELKLCLLNHKSLQTLIQTEVKEIEQIMHKRQKKSRVKLLEQDQLFHQELLERALLNFDEWSLKKALFNL